MNNILQIKKYFSAVFLTALLICLLCPAISVHASGMLWDSYEIPSTRQKERLLDAADLLSDSEESDLLVKLNQVSEKHRSNIVILTANSHTGPIQDYADDYFDYNGFQADYDGAGVLFMLSMEDREWAISTSGSGIEAFTDYGQEVMTDEMLPYLSSGDYYTAFCIEVADNYYTLYEQGTPFDRGYKDRSGKTLLSGGLICVLIGFILALIPIFVMKSDLQSVHHLVSASGYQSHAGLNMTRHTDTYLRSTTSRTRKPENDGGSRSGGGGSSVHISSSGSSHGGSHGHF